MPVLKFAELARSDLHQIGAYIQKDSPTDAARFVARITRSCRQLATNPGMGRPRPDMGAKIHSFPVRPYLVFYRPLDGGIVVLRIIHGARDLQRAFDE